MPTFTTDVFTGGCHGTTAACLQLPRQAFLWAGPGTLLHSCLLFHGLDTWVIYLWPINTILAHRLSVGGKKKERKNTHTHAAAPHTPGRSWNILDTLISHGSATVTDIPDMHTHTRGIVGHAFRAAHCACCTRAIAQRLRA